MYWKCKSGHSPTNIKRVYYDHFYANQPENSDAKNKFLEKWNTKDDTRKAVKYENPPSFLRNESHNLKPSDKANS